MDFLFLEYQLNHFADIDLSNQDLSDPDWLQIYKYVDAVQKRELKFDDIPTKYRYMLAEFLTRD